MQDTIIYNIFKTKWGYFGLAGSKKGICRTCLPLPTANLVKKTLLKGLSDTKNEKNAFRHTEKLITAYFKGSYVNFDRQIPLLLHNFSPFAKKILNICRNIKVGQTITYKQLAFRAGRPNASRAVGRIMAANPLPLIIPCHRVIKSNGQLGGFSAAGGLSMKKKLIDHEQKISVL